MNAVPNITLYGSTEIQTVTTTVQNKIRTVKLDVMRKRLQTTRKETEQERSLKLIESAIMLRTCPKNEYWKGGAEGDDRE